MYLDKDRCRILGILTEARCSVTTCTQYKAAVEYAPSQSVPKPWLKRDGRAGTIFKDHEYVEFLEFIGKPVDHLPSAEIQLERREAEKAAAGKEAIIITPLMQFIRQKRAANSGSRRSLNSGKSVRRIGRRSSDSSRPVSSKQSERIGVSTTVAKIPSSRSIKPNKQRETGGKIIKSILQPDRVKQSSQVERDRHSQPSNIRILSKSNAVLDVEISSSDRKVADN